PAERGLAEDLAEEAHRLRALPGEDAAVIAGGLFGRERVDLAAQRFDPLGDLVRGVPARSLEHHVLDEMGDTRLLSRLMAGAALHPDAESERGNVIGRFGENREAPRKLSPQHDRFLDRADLSQELHGLSSEEADGAWRVEPDPGAVVPVPLRARAAKPRTGCARPARTGSDQASAGAVSSTALRDRRIFPSSSTPITFTRTMSFSRTTSSTCATRWLSSSEMWTSPSRPGRISTTAPKATIRLTFPR